jgi:hypothetical protein
MGLAETQNALARIYTDNALRERFFADPQTVGLELGLRSDEAEQLARISAQKAAHFAASLLNKRIHEVAKLLPLSSRLLGQQFRKLFRDYAATHLPVGAKKHLEDAIGFAAFAERSPLIEHSTPLWASELLAYEREFLRAGEPKPYLRWRRFRYPVHDIARRLSKGEQVDPQLEARPVLLLWFRLSKNGGLRHRVIESKGKASKGQSEKGETGQR